MNGVNDTTDYRSGNGLHVDLSATKFLTKDFSVGVIASHYQQVTGDSGEGATLGPYKGRVTAVGGTVGYTFEVGKIPVSTRVKVLREVDVENRFRARWVSCRSRSRSGSPRMPRRRSRWSRNSRFRRSDRGEARGTDWMRARLGGVDFRSRLGWE